MNKKILTIFAIVIVIAVVIGVPIILVPEEGKISNSDKTLPDEITLDYANWSFISLVLRDKKFLEEEFANDNVKLNWVLTQSGSKSMEFLLSESVDIGTAAGVGGIMSYINGNPIKAVYVTHVGAGEILVSSNSIINDIKDLRGKNIAVTPATNPYLFLIGTLNIAGLSKNDVNIVPLQPSDGVLALLRGDVDAWSGGVELSAPFTTGNDADKVKSIFKSTNFNTPCFLYSRIEFAQRYPEVLIRILSAYDKARSWALSHPEEFIKLVAKENKMSIDSARLMVDGVDINFSGEIRDIDRDAMFTTEIILDQTVKEGTDIRKKVDELLDRDIFRKP